MKHTARLWTLLLISLVLFNCGTTADRKSPATKTQAKVDRSITKEVGWIPPGSDTEQDGSRLHIKAPQGWSYIGYNGEGIAAYGSGDFTTSISCSCNSFSNYNASNSSESAGINVACNGGECSIHHQLELKDSYLLTFGGGYFQPAAPIHILEPGEQAPAAFDALFLELPAFREQLSRLLARAHYGVPMAHPVKNPDGSITAPVGYSLIALSIMGRGLVAVIPEKVAREQKGYLAISKATCDCRGGRCSLKIRTVLGTGVVWCDGKCKETCSLTGSVKASDTTSAKPLPIKISTYSF